jgi:hypothetical protein
VRRKDDAGGESGFSVFLHVLADKRERRTI